MRRILLVGGGTGGHIFPLIAVAQAIQEFARQNSIEIDLRVLGEGRFIRQACVENNLKFKSDNFDVILAVNLIEHVHDFEFLLNEFERILKKGGYLFITTYDTNFVLHKILNDPTHVYEWDEISFEKFISKKFKIIKSFKHGSFFNYYPFNKIIVRFLKPELCVVATKN